MRGNLVDFSPYDLFELFDLKRKTGVLLVTSTDETVTLGFKKGTLAVAESTKKRSDMMLGKVLIRSGRITKEQRDRGLEIQKKTLECLGPILCREQYCTEEAISAALQVQMKWVVFNFLRWNEGSYVIESQKTLELFHGIVKPLKVRNLLMEGAVIIDEWPRIEKKIPSLDMIFQHRSTSKKIVSDTAEIPLELIDLENTSLETGTVELTGEEEIVYQRLDGKTTIRNVMDQAILSEFDCCKTFYALHQKGLIEEISDAPDPEKAALEVTQSESETRVSWGIVKALLKGKFPEATIVEINTANEEAILLHGKTDITTWPGPIIPIMKRVWMMEKDQATGNLEYIVDDVGVALFWDLRNDTLLATVSPLVGQGAISRFRANIAIVARSILQRTAQDINREQDINALKENKPYASK